MTDPADGRGVLYPGALPLFHRRAAPEPLRGLVHWYWISQWDLPPREQSRQSILPFPASNLVVQPEEVTLSGPTSGLSIRVLTGKGWAFGVLLRAAGLHLLDVVPKELVDIEAPFAADDLAAEVRVHMDAGDCEAASSAVSRWLSELKAAHEGETPAGAAVADALVETAAADPAVVRIDQLADRLGVSTRALQRLSKQYIGQSPLAIIRRYRLQEAALRLRENPDLTVAAVAAELGYADQAHLASDFRTTLGFAARDYRRRRQP